MAGEDAALFSLGFVRVAVPIVLLAISVSLGSLRRPAARIELVENEHLEEITIKSPRRWPILGSFVVVSITYFLDGLCFILQSVIGKTWLGLGGNGPALSRTIGLDFESVAGLVATGLLASIGVWKDIQDIPVWSLRRLKVWASVALVGSVAEAILELVIAYDEAASNRKIWRCLHTAFLAIRIICIAVLLAALAHPRLRKMTSQERPSLESGAVNSNATNSETLDGTTTQSDQESTVKDDKDEDSSSERKYSLTEIVKHLVNLSLRLWPRKSVKLQSLVGVCILSVLLERFIGPINSLAFGKIIEVLEIQSAPTEPGETGPSFWPYLLTYSGLSFLKSTMGIYTIRSLAWTPISQYMDRQMTRITFSHLFSLSLSYHTRRKTGEITKIISRGAVVDELIDNFLLFIGPAYVDLVIAAAFFRWMYGWSLALIMFALEIFYVAVSLWLNGRMRKMIREQNDLYYAASGMETDLLLNYETIKYFGGEQLETDRYVNATRKTQDASFRVTKGYTFLNVVQSWISGIAYLVGASLIAMRIARGELSPSDFATFSTYIQQVFYPLDVIVFQFQDYNHKIVNAEKLIDLLNEPLDVVDKPDAPDLVNAAGEIEFDNVHFSYDGGRTMALKGVSFKIKKGASVALVGASGSGKSTILRLLFRLYDVKEGEGRILIDGQDIRDITQASLRKAIGIVPQEPVLFNESIEYNIGYGKPGSSRKEIEAAAGLACLHDRISSAFKDGYATLVGERGVRLSGGEKQRVSIARAFLKDSPVLVLDEATSALDTSTEREIQTALRSLMRGRSSLSVAHRLSTIASANLILVLKDGQIVEQGGHRELLEQNGIFAKMWADQVEVTDAELVPTGDDNLVEEDSKQAPLISL